MKLLKAVALQPSLFFIGFIIFKIYKQNVDGRVS